MSEHLSRRAFLSCAGSCAGAVRAASPDARVAVAKLQRYGRDVLPTIARMFDQLGGLGRIVRNKTVAIKLNLGGPATVRLGRRPHECSNWVHPGVIGAVLHLMARAGARRIRLLEGARFTADPLEEHMLQAGWEPQDFLRAAPRVELVNPNTLGRGGKYLVVPVPGGGGIFRAFALHPACQECDVFISLAKLKEHRTTGITLAMKNCFGITPTSVYGDDAGQDEPNEHPQGGRGAVMHYGRRQPSRLAPPENDPSSPRQGGYRVPRIVVDIVAARPVDLALIDGVESMAGGEGVANPEVVPVSPGVMVAGTNVVAVDAVAMAVMGYDPMADRGTEPFANCDSTLRLAEERGLGTRRLDRIEVTGTRISEARFDFALARRWAQATDPFTDLQKLPA